MISHDEWYAAMNEISRLRKALETVIEKLTVVIAGHAYIPNGAQDAVKEAREALKTTYPAADQPEKGE